MEHSLVRLFGSSGVVDNGLKQVASPVRGSKNTLYQKLETDVVRLANCLSVWMRKMKGKRSRALVSTSVSVCVCASDKSTTWKINHAREPHGQLTVRQPRRPTHWKVQDLSDSSGVESQLSPLVSTSASWTRILRSK